MSYWMANYWWILAVLALWSGASLAYAQIWRVEFIGRQTKGDLISSRRVSLDRAMKRKMYWRGLLLFPALAILLLLALSPSSDFHQLGLPRSLTRFLTKNDFLCYFGAYLTLTALTGLALPRRFSVNIPIAASLILTASLELTQHFLPDRFCDLNDFCAGWLGTMVAGLALSKLRGQPMSFGLDGVEWGGSTVGDLANQTPFLGTQRRAETDFVLGVPFFNGDVDRATELAAEGGLVVCPSGPGMSGDLLAEPAYREALKGADLVLTDSAVMVMAWNMVSREPLRRTSGLRFLRSILESPHLREANSSFWVMPSEEERVRDLEWLNAHDVPVKLEQTYIAPMYGSGSLEDSELVARIRECNPRWVILGIGGGAQERLGYYLRQQLDPCPSIICIGAAIGFLTGTQASIPPWADRMYLGWLLRCIDRPSLYIPRYLKSIHLPLLIWKHRDRMPPLVGKS